MFRKKVNYPRFIEEFGHDPMQFIVGRFREGYTHLLLGEMHDSHARHRFTAQLLPVLMSELRTVTLCLELENFLQDDIDDYLKNGNPSGLEKVIERENQLNPKNGRNFSGYYDIIETARRYGVPIIAIDDVHYSGEETREERMNRRNAFMSSAVPKDKICLVYIGQGHMGKGNWTYLVSSMVYDELNNGAYPYAIAQEASNEELTTLGLPLGITTSSVALDLRETKVQLMFDEFANKYSKKPEMFRKIGQRVDILKVHILPITKTYDAFIYHPNAGLMEH